MGSIQVPPISRKDILNLTCKLRKSFELDNRLFFSIVDFLKFVLSQIDSGFHYEIVEDYELEFDHANYDPAKKLMKIRRLLLKNQLSLS